MRLLVYPRRLAPAQCTSFFTSFFTPSCPVHLFLHPRRLPYAVFSCAYSCLNPFVLPTVPQHPMLLAGTVRSNLDPFRHATDDELWAVLERVQLKKYFQEQQEGLDEPIAACKL